MTMRLQPAQKEIIASVLERYGTTFSQELGINAVTPSGSDLFRLLCATLLFSVPIGWKTALAAARKLADNGWITPNTMVHSTWEERVRALDIAKYVRYDESMATKLGEMAHRIIDEYHGDLACLRVEAGHNPEKEGVLLQEFKGIGEVGTAIFFREIQCAWEEIYPFIDDKALAAARKLGLKGDAHSLAAMTGRTDFTRFVAALVRIDLENAYDTFS